MRLRMNLFLAKRREITLGIVLIALAVLISIAASSIGAPEPKFLVSSENKTLESGKWQYLVCEADGEKPIDYKWYNQDEDRITDDAEQPVHVSRHASESRLNFKKLGPEHEGSYTCTAKNSHGLASKVYFLRVSNTSDGNDTDIDKGNKTTGFQNAEVLESTTRSVTFLISTSGPVEYIEAKYTEGKGRFRSNATLVRLDPAPENIYQIRNLLPSRFYTFQFRTVPLQNDGWSKEYNVTLLPDPPEIIWKSIGDLSVRFGWFTKFDDSLKGMIDKYQIKYFSVQQSGGNVWIPRSNCTVTIEIPTCYGSNGYTISELGRSVYYQIELRAHTEAGYGEPTTQKIFM